VTPDSKTATGDKSYRLDAADDWHLSKHPDLERERAEFPKAATEFLADGANIAALHAGWDAATSCAPPTHLAEAGPLFRWVCASCGERFGSDKGKLFSVQSFSRLAGDILTPKQPMMDRVAHVPATELDKVRLHNTPLLDGKWLWRSGLYGEVVNPAENESIYKTIVDGETPTAVAACRGCQTSLVAQRVPRFAMANNQFYGSIPEVLRVLTVAELVLVMMVRHRAFVQYLRPFDNQKWMSGHRALKGNVCTVPQDMPGLATALPLSGADMLEVLRVIFIGKTLPAPEDLRRSYAVDGRKVDAALKWLITNNPLYKRQYELSTQGKGPVTFRPFVKAFPDHEDGEIPAELYKFIQNAHVERSDVSSESTGYVPNGTSPPPNPPTPRPAVPLCASSPPVRRN
jgi:hypothetical protein